MRIALHSDVPGVPPDAALAWWSDFQEGPTDHAFVPGQRRTLLGRDADGARMRDETRVLGVLLFRETTTARVETDRVTFDGRNTVSRFVGAYVFSPLDPGGTRITLDAEVTLKPPLGWTRPLARRVATAILRADLSHHARDMAHDLGKG